MKKKITIIAVCALVALILLAPVPMHLKDGGTVVYRALLYSVEDVHRLGDVESEYVEGTVVRVLGMKVFDSTY